MDWIGRAQDRDRWQTLVSAVMNLKREDREKVEYMIKR